MSRSNSKILKVGIVGTIISVVCCFTPLAVVLLSAVGLSALVGWLDYILLPALAFFILLSIFAFFRKSDPTNSE